VHILYFADIRFPLERANGIQTMETCHALAERGHTVHLAVRPDTDARARDPFEYYGLPAQPRLQVERARVTGPETARRVGYLAYAAGRVSGSARADIVMTRDLSVASMLLQLPRAMRPPVVYESHGYAPDVSAALPDLVATAARPSAAKLRRLARREEAVWRNADGYVTITAGLAEELRRRFGDRRFVAVIADGVRGADSERDADHTRLPRTRITRIAEASTGRGSHGSHEPSTDADRTDYTNLQRGRGSHDYTNLQRDADRTDYTNLQRDADRTDYTNLQRDADRTDHSNPRTPIARITRTFNGRGSHGSLESTGRRSDGSPHHDRRVCGASLSVEGRGRVARRARAGAGCGGLIVGGPDGEPDLGRLKARSAELGIGGRVTFTGLVPPPRVRELLGRADILVLPNPASAISTRYTSPLKLFEYMAAARAIIASDLPSIREVLTHESTALLVAPESLRHWLPRFGGCAAIRPCARSWRARRRCGGECSWGVEPSAWKRSSAR
jgi:glycosyltransferase involved in cell wall biosynthesis